MSEQLPTERDPNRVYVSMAPDGSMQLSQGDATATFENPIVAQKRNEEAKSGAAARLARLRGEGGETSAEIIRVDVARDSQPWFIRRLALEDVTRVGIYGGRDSQGRINLNDEGAFTGLLAAMLFVAVCNEDGTPFYTVFGEAYAQAADRTYNVVEINADLFAMILKHNPGVLPEAQGSEKKTSESASGSTIGTQVKDSTRSVVAAPRRGSKKKRFIGKRR